MVVLLTFFPACIACTCSWLYTNVREFDIYLEEMEWSKCHGVDRIHGVYGMEHWPKYLFLISICGPIHHTTESRWSRLLLWTPVSNCFQPIFSVTTQTLVLFRELDLRPAMRLFKLVQSDPDEYIPIYRFT